MKNHENQMFLVTDKTAKMNFPGFEQACLLKLSSYLTNTVLYIDD